jgi:CBS domain-containing protein
MSVLNKIKIEHTSPLFPELPPMADPTRSNLTAADVMTTNPRTCSAFSSVLEASALFQDAKCGAVPVVDAGRPIGILTDRDVALAVANNPDLRTLPVADFMSKEVVSVAPETSLEEIGAMFGQHGIHRVLVVDASGQLQGIVSLSDLAAHFSEGGLGRVVSAVNERR